MVTWAEGELRAELWLDEPAQWARLADAAEAWAFRQSRGGRALTGPETLAARWCAEEVVPVLERLRAGSAPAGRAGLRHRARRPRGVRLAEWPADPADQIFDPAGRPRT
jgi:hypothetical protein